MKKNNAGGVVTGIALSGNDPMQSLNVKGLGKAIDDPANFYLALAEGGFVDGDKMSERNVPYAQEIGMRTIKGIVDSISVINLTRHFITICICSPSSS